MKHFAIIVSKEEQSTKLYLKLDEDITNRNELSKVLSKLVKDGYNIAVLRTRSNKEFLTLQELMYKLPKIRLFKTVEKTVKVGDSTIHRGTYMQLPLGVLIDHHWESQSPNYSRINHFIALKPANKCINLNLNQIASELNKAWNQSDRPHCYFIKFAKEVSGIYFTTSDDTVRVVDSCNEVLRIEWTEKTPIYTSIKERIEL